MSNKLDEFKLLEGQTKDTNFGVSIKLLNIKNNHTCKVRVRHKGGMGLVTVGKWYSTPVTKDKRICLQAIEGYSEAILVLMDNHSSMKISKSVRYSAKMLGVLNLKEIIENSTPYSSGSYTHIYQDWLLTIKDREVLNIHLIGCFYCMDTGKIEVHNECPTCLGRGCAKCNQTGQHKDNIPCPACRKQKTKLIKERKHYEKNHNKRRH